MQRQTVPRHIDIAGNKRLPVTKNTATVDVTTKYAEYII
jgi:hypothetical protein